MKENEENINFDFLKKDKLQGSDLHKKFLGTDVPENYFAKSKLSILDKIKQEEELEEELVETKTTKVFYLRPQFKYAVAASLVFILSLTIWLQQNTTTEDLDSTNLELFALQDDVLLESLLVDDGDIDAFTEETLIDEIVVKAEKKAQNMDDLILESLIVEDSLLDDYLKEELIDAVIL